MKLSPLAIALVATFGLGSTRTDAQDAHGHEMHLPTEAVCVLMPTKDNKVRGRITFKEVNGVTQIRGNVNNLTPGEHGFHIHEFGDLRSQDGTAAGGHFNPEGKEHGGPHADAHHMGDLGNITANEEGKAQVKVDVKGLKVHFILGRSIVVHADKDDLTSQPTGNAGPRVAVGVIGVAGPVAKPAAKK